jgi:hypothetical protein
METSAAPAPTESFSEVKIKSARKTSRKKICEILRQSGNLIRATKLPPALVHPAANGKSGGWVALFLFAEVFPERFVELRAEDVE